MMFQLVIGLQWQVAHAGVTPPEQQASLREAGHCPAHNNPAAKHDCCRSLGCQCHCAQSPVVLDLPMTSAAPSSFLLLPVVDARPSATRENEFFRPPIA